MLDVHPPHHPTNTWKDFFIHIATISVGLLIAIALEQAVEALHHRHQVHELEEQLHKEAVANSKRITRSFTASDAELNWLLALQQDAQAMLAGGPKLTYRKRPESDPGVPVIWSLPLTGVWDAAKQSGVVALLPAQQADLYTADYHQADISYGYRTRFFEALAHQQAYESQFGFVGCPLIPNLARLSLPQLEHYSSLVGESFSAGLAAKNRLRIFEWVHAGVLQDLTQQGQEAARLAAMQGHPDIFVPPAPGTPASKSTPLQHCV